MKKIASLLILLTVLVSCGSDVKFNNPGFQAQKDNYLWKADHTETIIANGTMTITAFHGAEKLSLVVPAPTAAIVNSKPSVDTLGIDDKTFANYQQTQDGVVLTYKTGKKVGNGLVVINEYNPTTKKLSGSFRLNATYQGVDASIPVNVNFQNGFIYQIAVQ